MREQHPELTPTQTKAINKLFDVGLDGFANGISTEKYVNLCRVSRATAYRELTALCEMGVLVQTEGAGHKVSVGEPTIQQWSHIGFAQVMPDFGDDRDGNAC